MTETTDLAVLEIKPEQAPALYVQSGLDGFLEQIRKSVNEVPDLTTAKGRARVASLAAQVSRSKTAIEKPGREYLKRLKEAVKPAEAEIKRFVDECDALRDETRRPLTEWEAEQERIKAEEKFNADHAEALEMNAAFDKALAERIESDHEIALLMNEKFDRDKAEAARIAEQQRIENEQRIAREAAERVKREEEEKARREREEAERRERELHAAVERERRERIAAEQRAELDKQKAIEEERRKAQEAEEKRLAEDRRIKDELAKRTANENHRKRIGSEVVGGLINIVGLSREQAISTLSAIKDGTIPHTSINY